MKANVATLTSKGQLVIPVAIRKKLHLGNGVRMNVSEQEGRIILQPVTPGFIHSFRGILKRKPGRKSVGQQLLEDRAEDLKHEEKKIARARSR